MEVLFNNIFTRYYVLNLTILNAKVIKEKACEKFLEIPNILLRTAQISWESQNCRLNKEKEI
jgi:hypothetical protein